VRFLDRQDAGRRLGRHLADLGVAEPDPVVLGLPRGGVVVAYEVARALDAPLDVIVVRKLGVPFQPEYAMGAVAEGGVDLLDQEAVRMLGITRDQVEGVRRREQGELDRRVHQLREGRPAISLDGRVAVLVDDGLATGATALVACRAARLRGARRVVLAVPVAPREPTPLLYQVADAVICLRRPLHFGSVGASYRDFAPTPDELVVELLARRRLECGNGQRPEQPVRAQPLG
jgi:putative phosphoribosyl transferase